MDSISNLDLKLTNGTILTGAILQDETNAGEGIKFPAALRTYVTWFLPLLIAFIYLKGYYDMFSGKDTLTFVCWMIAAVVFLGFICWCAWKKPTAKKAV